MNGTPLMLRGSVTEQKEILPLRQGANLLDSVQHAMIRGFAYKPLYGRGERC